MPSFADSCPSYAGYLGVTVAVFGFGTQGCFVKSNRIRAANVHPFLVVALFSLGIALIGGCLGLAGGLSATPFGAPFWRVEHWERAVFAACAYAPGNVLLLWACRRIGVGLAVGLCCSSTTVVSFSLGAGLGMDEGGDLALQVPGVALLVVSAGAMSLTRVPYFTQWLLPPEERSGALWDLYRRLRAEGWQCDAKGYVTSFLPASLCLLKFKK